MVSEGTMPFMRLCISTGIGDQIQFRHLIEKKVTLRAVLNNSDKCSCAHQFSAGIAFKELLRYQREIV